MNKSWFLSILIISFALLAIQSTHRVASLASFYRATGSVHLPHFSRAAKTLTGGKKDLLKLWESILTGKSRSVAEHLKERYQRLGLRHLFTPSGFHLSAVLYPFMKFFKHSRTRLGLLIIVAILLSFLPGLMALKRMVGIKSLQNLMGMKLGFVLALIGDTLFGSFQSGALSFTYSFLFLGIIYSGLKGIGITVWFFIAQLILAYFQGNDVSPLLLLLSPIINSVFALCLPLLFLLAFPLWNWQLNLGLCLLGGIQCIVDFCASLCQFVPTIEVHCFTLLMILFFMLKRNRIFLILTLVFSQSLNLDFQKSPKIPANEFVPQGMITKRVYEVDRVKILFSDGRCNLFLVRGYWWETCSPSKRRSKNKKILMKLSYRS